MVLFFSTEKHSTASAFDGGVACTLPQPIDLVSDPGAPPSVEAVLVMEMVRYLVLEGKRTECGSGLTSDSSTSQPTLLFQL